MAGEIQLNSTTFATESGGTITVANVDSATNRQNLGLEIGVDVQAFDTDTTKNDVANTFTANQIISVTDNTNAALRVTQLGTGNALVVEDSTNPDSTPFVVDASGNCGIGTSSPRAKVDFGSGSGDGTLSQTISEYQAVFEAPQGTGDYGRNIGFAVTTAGISAAINTVDQGGASATGLSFSTGTAGSISERMRIDSSGSVNISGSLSKGSGSFKIDHPLDNKSDTHYLVHSFIEGPCADLIYRGKVQLVNGSATVNIDTAAGMTEGTFVALNREVQCFTSNESDWDAVRGYVTGNILTIECQNAESTSTISWLVIGERQDQHMYDTEWTDDNGKVIVEPLKEIEALEATT